MDDAKDFVFRFFRNSPQDLALAPPGLRLASAWFNSKDGISVDDGALTTPEESYRRWVKIVGPCGVARVSKALLEQEGLQLGKDPLDTPADLEANPSHRLVTGITNGKARRITKSAEIVFHLPDNILVFGANDTIGVDPPALR